MASLTGETIANNGSLSDDLFAYEQNVHKHIAAIEQLADEGLYGEAGRNNTQFISDLEEAKKLLSPEAFTKFRQKRAAERVASYQENRISWTNIPSSEDALATIEAAVTKKREAINQEIANITKDLGSKNYTPKQRKALEDLKKYYESYNDADYIESLIGERREQLGLTHKTSAQKADEWYNERLALSDVTQKRKDKAIEDAREELINARHAHSAAGKVGGQTLTDAAQRLKDAQKAYDDALLLPDNTKEKAILKIQRDALEDYYKFTENQENKNFYQNLFGTSMTSSERRDIVKENIIARINDRIASLPTDSPEIARLRSILKDNTLINRLVDDDMKIYEDSAQLEKQSHRANYNNLLRQTDNSQRQLLGDTVTEETQKRERREREEARISSENLALQKQINENKQKRLSFRDEKGNVRPEFAKDDISLENENTELQNRIKRNDDQLNNLDNFLASDYHAIQREHDIRRKQMEVQATQADFNMQSMENQLKFEQKTPENQARAARNQMEFQIRSQMLQDEINKSNTQTEIDKLSQRKANGEFLLINGERVAKTGSEADFRALQARMRDIQARDIQYRNFLNMLDPYEDQLKQSTEGFNAQRISDLDFQNMMSERQREQQNSRYARSRYSNMGRFAQYYYRDRDRKFELETQRANAKQGMLRAETKIKNETEPQKIAEAKKEFEGYKQAAANAETELQKFGTVQNIVAAGAHALSDSISMVVRRFGRQMFYKALQEAKKFVQEFNQQMTTIQMITLKSDEQMSTLGDGLIAKAKELKVSIREITQSAATLYRQGLTDEEVDQRLEVISKFSKVSGTKVDDATKLITVAVNTGLVSDAQQAADVVTALGDNAATNAQQIEKGIEKAGAAAAADGTTFAELASMLTAITSTTQIGGNVAGRTLNTIFGRMNKVGTNELIYDENGNVVSGSAVAKLLSKQGIKTYDNFGNKRSSYDVLYDLSQIWDNLKDVEQQQIANAIAGTRQYSNFAAIMQGMSEGKVDEYMSLAASSTGITDEKYSIYTKSLQASLTDL